MVLSPQNELPDPADVTLALELAGAAKELMTRLGLSGRRAAEKAGLSEGAVSGLINAKAFPRKETFEVFITKGCGQKWEPWYEAWKRAHKDVLRRRTAEEVAADVEQLQRQVEQLEATLSAVRDQLAGLGDQVAEIHDVRRAAQDEHEKSLRRIEEGYRLLEPVDAPSFLVEKISWARDAEGTPLSDLYDIGAVDAFLEEVRRHATIGTSHLRHFLRTHAGTFRRPGSDTTFGYRSQEVDKYVSQVRQVVELEKS